MTQEERIQAIEGIIKEFLKRVSLENETTLDLATAIEASIGVDEDKLYDILTSVECKDEYRNLSSMYVLDKITQSNNIINIKEQK